MNIFYVDSDPKICATWLDDKRLCKMIVETAQLLSTAILYYGGIAPYKSIFPKHPCTLWVKKNKNHAEWLIEYYGALLKEYRKRFEKQYPTDYSKIFTASLDLFPASRLENPPNVTLYKNCERSFIPIEDLYKATLYQKWFFDKKKPRKYREEFDFSLDYYFKEIIKPYAEKLHWAPNPQEWDAGGDQYAKLDFEIAIKESSSNWDETPKELAKLMVSIVARRPIEALTSPSLYLRTLVKLIREHENNTSLSKDLNKEPFK